MCKFKLICHELLHVIFSNENDFEQDLNKILSKIKQDIK